MDTQARKQSGEKMTYDASGRPPHVFVMSDVRIVRFGLCELLRAARMDWNVTMGASAGDAVASHTSTLGNGNTGSASTRFDVVVLDMSMKDALDCARELSANRECCVVAFAAVDSDDALLAYVEAGIVGFVSREGSVADLIATVESALSGEAWLSPRLTGTLMRRLAELRSTHEPAAPSLGLTQREREILRLIDEGLSNKQIAARLVIELATVKIHVHHILEKTHAHRRGEAAAFLRRSRRSI
ncbi:MAG TPA: response regulator transcription factor [Gemmatimonadaceae bacterium]|nr:response regulator transcription factor [Gemmatimonadaceae bacterium]